MENDELAEAVLQRLQKEYPWLYPKPWGWFDVILFFAALGLMAMFAL